MNQSHTVWIDVLYLVLYPIQIFKNRFSVNFFDIPKFHSFPHHAQYKSNDIQDHEFIQMLISLVATKSCSCWKASRTKTTRPMLIWLSNFIKCCTVIKMNIFYARMRAFFRFYNQFMCINFSQLKLMIIQCKFL